MSRAAAESHALQMIYAMRRRVQDARSRYWAEAADCEITDGTHRHLAIVCMQYHDVLVEYRDTLDIPDGDWPDITPIASSLGKTVENRVESDVFGEDWTTERVPAIQTIPAVDMIEITHELDDIANKLGFAADVEQTAGGQDDV